jgi:hypothetical protein
MKRSLSDDLHRFFFQQTNGESMEIAIGPVYGNSREGIYIKNGEDGYEIVASCTAQGAPRLKSFLTRMSADISCDVRDADD